MTREPIELDPRPADGEEAQAGVHRCRFRLPEDFVYFAGHFRGHPVLPAVAQLEALVLPAVAVAFPELGPLRRARRLKFLQPLRPGDDVDLRLVRKGEPGSVVFELSREREPVASGLLQFAPP